MRKLSANSWITYRVDHIDRVFVKFERGGLYGRLDDGLDGGIDGGLNGEFDISRIKSNI